MFKLRIRLNGKQLDEILLEPDQEYTAGRGSECQIKLEAIKGISRQHFSISFNGAWVIKKISKFGDLVFEGEQRPEFQIERQGHFLVAPYEFEIFEELKSEVDPEVPKTPSEESALVPVTEAETIITEPIGDGFLKFIDDLGAQIDLVELNRSVNTAGRDPQNEVVIKDQRVSRKQFKISFLNNQFYIQDLGSVNGTLLNGVPLSAQSQTKLKSGDQISVLDHNIVFEIKDTNFQAKIENLPQLSDSRSGVPPMEEEPSPEGQLPELYQGGNEFPPPMDPNYPGGYDNQLAPYTGAPSGGIEPYQPPFYQQGDYQQPTPPPFGFEAEDKKTLKILGIEIELTPKNKMRLILVALIFLGGAYYVSEQLNPPAAETADVGPVDPFMKLTPEQQAEIKHNIVLARNLYRQANYELARVELSKIHVLLPKGYEDSLELEKFVEEAIKTKQELDKQGQIEKEKKEAEEKVKSIVEDCRKLVTPDVDPETVHQCLVPALEINPEHELIIALKAELDLIAEERTRKAAEAAQFRELAGKLYALYEKAEKIAKKNPLDGIDAFTKVTKSGLPDPKGLKAKAKKRIAEIQAEIDSQIAKAMEESKKLYDAGDIRNAVLTLEKAFPLDPKNQAIREESKRMRHELKKAMQVYYQEAVVEENIGNVETAKDRWKKILKLDVPDGDYYIKSNMKLKKYGPF